MPRGEFNINLRRRELTKLWFRPDDPKSRLRHRIALDDWPPFCNGAVVRPVLKHSSNCSGE